jgi:hypothetical protein
MQHQTDSAKFNLTLKLTISYNLKQFNIQDTSDKNE